MTSRKIDLNKFIGQRVEVRYRSRIREWVRVERNEDPARGRYPFNLGGTLYTAEGRFWAPDIDHYLDIEEISLIKDESAIDLSQYVNQEVVVTLRNGDRKNGVLARRSTYVANSRSYPYELKGIAYTPEGYYYASGGCEYDIVEIELCPAHDDQDTKVDVNDPVNHPAHYTQHPSGIECIAVTRHFNLNRGTAIGYIWRAKYKGTEIQDLKKAVWHLQDEIAQLERAQSTKES